MTTTVTPISEADFAQMAILFKEFAVFQNSSEKMTNSVERMKKEKDFLLGFVVKDKTNEILGYVTCFFSYYTWTGKCLNMDDLYVCQKCRGRGLGTMLINKVISFAKENDCHKLRWQVSNWNHPAIQFYKSLGADVNDEEMNCDLIL